MVHMEMICAREEKKEIRARCLEFQSGRILPHNVSYQRSLTEWEARTGGLHGSI